MLKELNLELIKSLEVEESKQDDGYLTVQGVATTYGNADLEGDILVEGAIDIETERRKIKEDGLPLLKDHNYNTEGVVGFVDDIAQVDNNIVVTAKVLKEGNEGLVAKLKNKLVKNFSVRFNTSDFKKSANANERYIINKARLVELSLVTRPANARAKIEMVKHSIDNNNNYQQKEEKMTDNTNLELAKAVTEATKQATLDLKKEFNNELEKSKLELEKSYLEAQKQFLANASVGKAEPVNKSYEFLKAYASKDAEFLKGYNTSVNNQGGYLLPDGFSGELVDRTRYETANLMQRVDYQTVYKKTGTVTLKKQRPTAYYRNEFQAALAQQMKFGEEVYVQKCISAGVQASLEFLEFQGVMAVQDLAKQCRVAIQSRVEFEILYGSGNNQHLEGILTAKDNNGKFKVKRVETQTAEKITLDDVIKLRGHVRSGKLVYLMDELTWYELQTEKDNQGRYQIGFVYNQDTELPRINGVPVLTTGIIDRFFVDSEDKSLYQDSRILQAFNGITRKFVSGKDAVLLADFEQLYRLVSFPRSFMLDEKLAASATYEWYLHAFFDGKVLDEQAGAVLKIK